MSAPNIPLMEVKKVNDELNSKSLSFCLAKWLQVTVHLQNGHTHSCHHPKPHKIQLQELENDFSALHNTSEKKIARKEMLEGTRPKECEFCWKIEDSSPNNLSDRAIKSAQIWSYPRMDEVKNLPWDSNVIPAYVEVSFGNECNLRCAYCAPHISSSIMKEFKEFGEYSSQPDYSIKNLKESGLFPFSKDEKNPYVDAFWKWWPTITKELKVFRITGGEPLLNPNTFKFLEFIRNNPMPELTIAINSNLSVPKATFDKFINEIKYINENKLVKEFQLFTSIDTHGKNAEFIRFGLNYNELMANAKIFLEEIKDSELIFMCAYNAFSVINFRKLLIDILKLKNQYFDASGSTRVTLDIPYLQEPNFLSCYALTSDFIPFIKKDVIFLKENAINKEGKEIIFQTEISKLERIVAWVESIGESEHRRNSRRELFKFLKEYTHRKKIVLKDYVPEYLPFINECKKLYEH